MKNIEKSTITGAVPGGGHEAAEQAPAAPASPLIAPIILGPLSMAQPPTKPEASPLGDIFRKRLIECRWQLGGGDPGYEHMCQTHRDALN